LLKLTARITNPFCFSWAQRAPQHPGQKSSQANYFKLIILLEIQIKENQEEKFLRGK
jgi:hypothetical protein